MITNFMYPEDKKKNYFLVIPKSPKIFDKFDIFRLSVCTGCAITLSLYSMYFMASCVSLVCIAIIAFMFSQMTKNIKARMHIDCMKKLKKIYLFHPNFPVGAGGLEGHTFSSRVESSRVESPCAVTRFDST